MPAMGIGRREGTVWEPLICHSGPKPTTVPCYQNCSAFCKIKSMQDAFLQSVLLPHQNLSVASFLFFFSTSEKMNVSTED